MIFFFFWYRASLRVILLSLLLFTHQSLWWTFLNYIFSRRLPPLVGYSWSPTSSNPSSEQTSLPIMGSHSTLGPLCTSRGPAPTPRRAWYMPSSSTQHSSLLGYPSQRRRPTLSLPFSDYNVKRLYNSRKNFQSFIESHWSADLWLSLSLAQLT